eukprot:3319323-Rhodomonas_salina.1
MSLPSAAALPTSTETLGISQQHAEALRSFPGAELRVPGAESRLARNVARRQRFEDEAKDQGGVRGSRGLSGRGEGWRGWEGRGRAG